MESNRKYRKVFYILLAFFVSALIWFYVDMFGNNGGAYSATVTITDIPITYTGDSSLEERGLMLLDENTTTTLDLTLTGSRILVVQFTRDDFKVTVDLDKIERSGVQSVAYEVSYLDDRITNSMVKTRSPSTATVNISELNSKTVDIRYELVGNVAEGYSAGEPQLSQSTLEIRGEAQYIDLVSYAKVVLDIGDQAEETVTQNLTFQYYDASGNLLDETGIHPTVDSVQATLPVYVTKELELVVDFRESDGVRKENVNAVISPSTITVSGDAAALRNVSSITLGTFDLLELLNSGASVHTATYPIIIPNGCQNLSGVTRATMKISFKDMTDAEITTDQFTYSNLADGKYVKILTAELTASVFGTSDDVNAISGSDLRVVADLSNYASASGTYTVPAVIENTSNHDVGVSGSYFVQVTIQNEPFVEETPDEAPDPAEQ
jgi:YbbR domain-containing protein